MLSNQSSWSTKLFGNLQVNWAYFYGAAEEVMRRGLITFARSGRAIERGEDQRANDTNV
jgi:hypothetical protein